ncbi:D123-domain-containing protein [Colletotrichum lupini]|nr:D123-domain-containing protein [Colletotrichum lupini]
MGRWLTPHIQECMLNPSAAIHHFTKAEVRGLLEIAARLNHKLAKADKSQSLSGLAAEMEQKPKSLQDATSAGYFIRISHCSPKDADGGNLQPVNNMREALVKLVSSKRTVQALLSLFYQFGQNGKFSDNQLYFFPYYADLNRLSEWRCYIKRSHIVAISQSRFYQPNHAGITDEMLGRLASQARHLWSRIAPDLNFKSCILDVYAEVLDPEFEVKLIKINPWGAHSGSGSLLFHWLDDVEILDPQQHHSTTMIRLVEAGEAKALTRDEAFQIGRGGIIEDELRCLRERGLKWVLEDDRHAEFMGLPVPDGQSGLTTRKDGLEIFRKGLDGEVTGVRPTNHPRFLKLKRAYEASRWS